MPDETCPICLGAFDGQKSLVNDCLHSFCFDCIVEWSRVRLNCPLCKQRLRYLLYDIQEGPELHYKRYDFPSSPLPTAADTTSQATRTTTHHRRHYRQYRRRRRQSTERPLPEDVRVENAFQRRRLVYRYSVFAKHMGSNPLSSYRPITPDSFRQSTARLQRLRPWIRRDLHALLDDENVEILIQFIEGAIVRFPLQDQRMIDALHPFLTDKTEHFIHELVSFARSPFELNTYDTLVQYDWPDSAQEVSAIY